jgi:hypothetical protein
MAVDPNSLSNLEKGTKFVPGDSRINRLGRQPGKRNRKTIFKEWLEFEVGCKDPAGNEVQLSMIDKIALAVITKASEGDTTAVNIVLENTCGKISNLPESKSSVYIDWSRYTEEEIIQLNTLIRKGKIENNENELLPPWDFGIWVLDFEPGITPRDKNVIFPGHFRDILSQHFLNEANNL